MRRRRSIGDLFFDNLGWFLGIGAAVMALLVIITPIVYTVACYKNDRTVTCLVTDKDRASKDGGGSDMRIYTEDCGNFVVQDATFAKNFHSSDTFAEIETGHTYRLDVNGFRIPFLSEFPNILSAEPVD